MLSINFSTSFEDKFLVSNTYSLIFIILLLYHKPINTIILFDYCQQQKKPPVTEPGAKKNKIRSKLLLLVLILYHCSIYRQNKKLGQPLFVQKIISLYYNLIFFSKVDK